MKKDLTKITDLTPNEIKQIIDKSFTYKKDASISGLPSSILKGKVVAMIFEKPSLRTKIAFEAATAKLGGIPIFLTSNQIIASGNNEKGRESIPDIAKNLERFADLIITRVYDHKTIEAIANNISKPVINALCNKYHPTQALTDLMAIMWHKKEWKNIKVSFIGDANNVSTSLMHICALMGINFSVASPKNYTIKTEEYEVALKNAQKASSTIELLESPEAAVKNADVIYTDTFISMGEEHLKEQKLKDFKNYKVTAALLKKANKDCIFMHCLPAHRGEEVTDEVMDCESSIVFDQAECKLHTAKALLSTYLT